MPEIDEIVAAADSAALKLNNEAELVAAADRVAEATQRLAARTDAASWAAVDDLIPGSERYKGEPVTVAGVAAGGS